MVKLEIIAVGEITTIFYESEGVTNKYDVDIVKKIYGDLNGR